MPRFHGKEDGLLVGYAPLTENLQKAIAEYTDADQRDRTLGQDVERALDELRNEYDVITGILRGFGWKELLERPGNRAFIDAAMRTASYLRDPRTPGNNPEKLDDPRLPGQHPYPGRRYAECLRLPRTPHRQRRHVAASPLLTLGNPVDFWGMTTKSPNADKTTQTGTTSTAGHAFEMRFTSTRRGARLARRLAAVRLDAWGIPYDTDAHDAIVLIVAELAANAARHGRVPGRDFHLRLETPPGSAIVRVEVTDTRAEHLPRRPVLTSDPGEEEADRGLLIVSTLAVNWGWHARGNGPGKTVWAECATGPAATDDPPSENSLVVQGS